MELASSQWQIFGATTVFFAGGLVGLGLCQFLGLTRKRALFLYAWHTVFCIVYLLYVLDSGGDALAYYRSSLAGLSEFELGTNAVQWITFGFSSIAGMSILGTFLAFNIFGYIGLLALDGALRRATTDKSRQVRALAALIVLMPSISFWSSAIGKDSLAFMSVGLALWASIDLRKNISALVISVSIMFLVRPHIAVILVIAIATSMLLERRVSFVQRILIGSAAVAVAIVILPTAIEWSGLTGNPGFVELAEYVEVRQAYNLQGGGAVDISAMSLPLKLFTYMFRPLPYEAQSIPALAAALDNIVLLIVFILGLLEFLRGRRPTMIKNRSFLWVYAVSTWFVLAMTTSNLGIAVRQKWMFVPMLILLMVAGMSKSRSRPSIQLSEMSISGAGAEVVKS